MSESQNIKLKKKSDDEIHGPMDMSELVELSRSAFVAPEDEVSFDDGDWVPAPSIPQLEMIWIIRTSDGIEYGPTTVGTIREFLSLTIAVLKIPIFMPIATAIKKTGKVEGKPNEACNFVSCGGRDTSTVSLQFCQSYPY